MLQGYRTYICAAGVALVTAAHFMGWITTEQATALYGLLGAGGLASLRAAVRW